MAKRHDAMRYNTAKKSQPFNVMTRSAFRDQSNWTYRSK